MEFQKDDRGFTIWFNKKKGANKIYLSKCISIHFHYNHWKVLRASTNGAKKGILKHNCLDAQLWALGFCFNYVDWDYNNIRTQ